MAALGVQIFNIAKDEWKPIMEPHSMGDDFGGEAMASDVGMLDFGHLHQLPNRSPPIPKGDATALTMRMRLGSAASLACHTRLISCVALPTSVRRVNEIYQRIERPFVLPGSATFRIDVDLLGEGHRGIR